jgi:DivIVA domain-containing protein
VTGARRSRETGYLVRGRGRLTPEAIRRVRFRRAPTFSGLNPDDVRHFVAQVSADMASLYSELAEVYSENERIKNALRTWQSGQATRSDRPPR